MSYLAAGTDYNAFLKGLGPGNGASDIIARQVKQGRLLSAVSLERRPDNDDDWVVFEFDAPDAAVAPLRPANR